MIEINGEHVLDDTVKVIHDKCEWIQNEEVISKIIDDINSLWIKRWKRVLPTVNNEFKLWLMMDDGVARRLVKQKNRDPQISVVDEDFLLRHGYLLASSKWNKLFESGWWYKTTKKKMI